MVSVGDAAAAPIKTNVLIKLDYQGDEPIGSGACLETMIRKIT